MGVDVKLNLLDASSTAASTSAASSAAPLFVDNSTDVVYAANTTLTTFNTSSTPVLLHIGDSPVVHINIALLLVIIGLSGLALIVAYVNKRNRAARRYGGLAEGPVSRYGFQRSTEGTAPTPRWGIRSLTDSVSTEPWSNRDDFWEHRLIENMEEDAVYRPTSTPSAVTLEFSQGARH